MTKIKPKKCDVAQPASSSPPAENHSTFNLCKLIKLLNRKKLLALKWLQKIGMLNRETACDNCGRPMILVHRQNCTGSRADKYEWECNKCRMCTKSLRNGTVFQSSKLSLQKITILMYFWAHDFPPCVAQRELSITERTVNKWYLLCQEACMDALIRNTSKIGGEGRILEVVEGKLGKRAVDTYRTPAEHPAIGVIDVDSGRCLLQVVIGNTKATLLTILKERIANGTTLHSKCWRARDCYTDEKFCKVVRNHKLNLNGLNDEDGNTFQKLHAKVCTSKDKVGTELIFDPILCATIYKNAMKNEEYYFLKFLGELGTLYRDGIRYEMMSQLELSDSEPGPSSQQRETGKMEWTSTINSPCHKCRSKQYSNSEVQATPSDEITICEDSSEAQSASVSKRNTRKSGGVSEGNGTASDDIIMLEDTRNSRNSVTSEETPHTSGYNCRKQSTVCDDVLEVERADKPTNDGRSDKTAISSGYVSEADRAEANEVVMLEKHNELSNGSVREENIPILTHSLEVGRRATSDVILHGNPRNDGRAEGVGRVSGHRDVIDIGGDEPKEVHENVDEKRDSQPAAATPVGHIDEIDISREEQNDVHETGDERETGEKGVDGGDKARGDVNLTAGRKPMTVTRVVFNKDSAIIIYEEVDAHEDTSASAEQQSRAGSNVVNIDSVEDNAADVKVLPANISVPVENSFDTASQDTARDESIGVANGSTVKDAKTNVTADREREATSDLVNINYTEDNANESTLNGTKTNATTERKRERTSDLVNIDEVEDNAIEMTVKATKTDATTDRKKEAIPDLVNIDDAEDNANENTVKDNANENTVKGTKTNDTADRKRDAAPDTANIGEAEDNASEPTAKRSKTNETADNEKHAPSDLENSDNAEDQVNECTVQRSKTAAGKKRESASDLVNIDGAEDNADECTVKRSKTTGSAARKTETGSATVNIDDIEDNANELKDVTKGNATAKRKSDATSDVVNIDDIEDNSDKRKCVPGKTDATAERKKETASDIVNIDDVDESADECERPLKSANETARKVSEIVTDVIEIDEVDSDIEVIETEIDPVNDVMIVTKKVTEKFSAGTSRGKWRRASANAMSYDKSQTLTTRDIFTPPLLCEVHNRHTAL